MAALEAKVVRLRPHHVDLFFADWAFASKKEIISWHKNRSYGSRYFAQLFSLRDRLLNQDSPFEIVPALDDLCRECGRLIKSMFECKKPDSRNYSKPHFYFDATAGGIYLPHEVIEQKINSLESGYEVRKEHRLAALRVEHEIYKYRRLLKRLEKRQR